MKTVRGWRHRRRGAPSGLLRVPVILLTLLLALLLGGGIELLGHHDHAPFVEHGGCLLCRLADAPVDGAPPPPVVPEVFETPEPFLSWEPALVLPAGPANPSHPLRGPPTA